jgi:hypothetical protein
MEDHCVAFITNLDTNWQRYRSGDALPCENNGILTFAGNPRTARRFLHYQYVLLPVMNLAFCKVVARLDMLLRLFLA